MMEYNIGYIKGNTKIRSVGKMFFFNKNVLILIIATMGMFPLLLSFGGYYFRGDITSQMLPFVYETKRMFASGVPFWSWNTYFGDNFIASYAYYTVFNPFTWINCLFPYRYIGLGFTFILYLKFLLCGYVVQKYLRKIGFDEPLSLIGCLLYTFSSWAICNLFYYIFMEPMILLPFLLLFVERFLNKERHSYSGLAIATFVVVVVNYYFAAINLIVGTIYFLCRLLYLRIGQERFVMTLKATGCVSLGLLCASFILIPVLMQLRGSEYMAIDLSYFEVTGIAERIFWLIYPKAYEGKYLFYPFLHSTWRSNTAGIAVFGLLPAILLFTKKGKGWIKWLTAILVILYMTPLNGVFSLFTDCYYTRWAYALTLALILCTLYYLKEYGMPRLRYAGWYCAVTCGIFFLYTVFSIYWRIHTGEDVVHAKAIRMTMYAVLVAVNAVALLLICHREKNGSRRYIETVVAITVCTSLQFLIFSLPSVKNFPSEEPGITEADYFIRNEDFNCDGDFTHRTNFSVAKRGNSPACNFALICNRPSIEGFHSVQNRRILKWKNIASDTIHPKRVFSPSYNVKSFEALMSVKDLVVVGDESNDTCMSGIERNRSGMFTTYESDHFIPLGFVYDRYVLSNEIDYALQQDSHIDIPKILLSTLAIDKDDEKELAPYMQKGDVDLNASLDSLVAARKAIACDEFTGDTRGFDAHISLDKAAVVFFSVVADDGFIAYLDGEPTKIYETNLGFSSVIVPSGNHYISFRYFPPGLKLGLLFSAIGLVILALLFFRKKHNKNIVFRQEHSGALYEESI